MDIEMLRNFFMWSTIINAGIFALSFVMMKAVPGLVQGWSAYFIPLTKEQLNNSMGMFMGLYKLLIIFFNVVPWVVLEMMGK